MLPIDEYQKGNATAFEGDTLEDLFNTKIIIQSKANCNEVREKSLKNCIQDTLYYILEIHDKASKSSIDGDLTNLPHKCGSFLESITEFERYINNNIKVTLCQDLTQTILKILDNIQDIEERWRLCNYNEKKHFYYLVYQQIDEVARLIKTLFKYCEKTH